MVLFGCVFAAEPSFGITYTYTQIKVPNSIATAAAGINTSGQIVGWYNLSTGGSHGFLYTNGAFTTLDYPGSSSTVATGINDSGEIVGYYTLGTATHAYTLVGSQYTSFDYPGSNSTYAYALNGNGDIVGYYYDQHNAIHGYELSGGVFTAINVPNSTQTEALGINSLGDVTGNFNDSAGEHGFFYRNGTFQTVNVPSTTATTSVAGINDRERMVGTYVDPTLSKVQGFLTNLSKFVKIHDPASSTTFPFDINSKNVIVGIYFDSFGNEMAFMATPH